MDGSILNYFYNGTDLCIVDIELNFFVTIASEKLLEFLTFLKDFLRNTLTHVLYRKISMRLQFEIFYSVLFHRYKSIKSSYNQIFEKHTRGPVIIDKPERNY